MELLKGEDLDARLKRRAARPFSVHDACVWAIQIAQAVAVVHDAGLIHRDLKVSNIFLAQQRDGSELCKLLDFGIARAEDNSELTKTGVSLGTPSYMSPEQVRNLNVDRRSDIYSFGVLLFKLTTGKLPFTGEAIQVAMQHCTVEPPTPSSIAPNAGISPALDALILKALEKSPKSRLQSMREVEDALVELLRNEAPELAPAQKPSRPPTASNLPPGPPTGPQPIVPAPASATPAASAASPAHVIPPATIAPADPVTAVSSPVDSATPVSSPKYASTPGASILQTGVTEALPSQPTRPPTAKPRIMALAGALAIGVIGVVAFTLGGGSDPPSRPAPDPAPTQSPAKTAVEPQKPPPTPEPTKAEPAPPKAEPAPPRVDPASVDPTKPVAAEPEELPQLEPEVGDGKSVATQPAKKAVKQPAQPVDPLKQIERKAATCRKKHKAVEGPKIVIDYAIGIDGKVTRSIPSTRDALGECLADAVASTQFEPKLVLGRKIPL
jgi:serine/threonine-protein kinase